jgi:type II secretory ATPase GspE/PulE/Tfp pilus assembly ATPase PilB-like protein
MLPAFLVIAFVDTGGYVDGLKLVPILILMLLWARLLTWVDKDAEAAHLPRQILNTGILALGVAGFGLFLFLPNYWIALGSGAGAFLVSIGAYLIVRQQVVGLGDLKTELRTFAKGVVQREKKLKVKAGQVQLFAKGGRVVPAPESDDEPEDIKGYETAQGLLTEPLKKFAERIEVRPGDGASSVQYVVDGVAYNATGLEKAVAATGITYLKKLSGLDVEDRRKPQTGAMKAALNGKKHELEIATAGTTAGESLRISVDLKNKHDFKVDGLGLLPDQLQIVQHVMADLQGLVLVASPRSQGLTTLLYSILKGHDAFVNHLQTIERSSSEDLEGITLNKLPPNCSPQEEFKQVEWVCSQQPDAIMVDEVTNPASAAELVRFCSDGKRVYVGMRASSTFDAIMAWRRLVGNDALAVKPLQLVMAGRVMRRLCMACKVPYAPDPDTLKKLNMDPAKVSMLFQSRAQPLTDPKGRPIPCDFCQDLHFKGRFGAYELFVIDDEARQAIASGGTVNQLKTIFRKQHALYLQEVALMQVEAGETSVQEVLRVLRAGEPAAAKAGAAGAGRSGRGGQPPARV